MTLKETLKQLEALGTAKVRAQNARSGAGDDQFGVSLGDIRVLAKRIRTNHQLALSLWDTGNVDAQFLATLLVQPKNLSADEMNRMVRTVTFVRVADWLNAYVVRQHPDKETLRQAWMATDDRWAARAGWDLTAERVAKSPDGLALPALSWRFAWSTISTASWRLARASSRVAPWVFAPGSSSTNPMYPSGTFRNTAVNWRFMSL
jgi:3-methyladenine DNA glycosylase AlkD